MPDSDDLEPLFRTIIETVPAPMYTDGAPLQAHVTNLDASPFLGRLALCRVHAGHAARRASRSRGAGATARPSRSRSPSCCVTEALDRVPADAAGPGDIVADRRHPRDHHRRDARRPRRPAAAAAHHGRRAGHLDDDRHQHARRSPAGSRAPRSPPGWSRTGSTASWSATFDPRCCRPSARRLGGAGPRRAGAGDPGRADAPRGLRADGRQAAGGHPRDRRQAARAGRAADDRLPRGVPRRGHPAARRAQGPDGADGQPRHRLGADGVPGAGPWPDRLPHRVPHRHPRHRHRAPRLRGVRAVGGRAAHPAHRARWWPTARARRRRTR